MNANWFDVISFSSIAGAATFLGMYLILARADWSRRNSAALVSYSAGVLLGVGILHVLPEAQKLSDNTPFFVLLSFIMFYFLEHHLFFHASHEELHHVSLEVVAGHDACCANPHPLGVIAFAGMTLHSLIDGMVIGTGFEVGSETGLLSALAVIAHEVPEGIAMLSILLHYGYSRRTGIAFTATVAMATPIGAVAAYFFVQQLAPDILGNLMAFAAGSFIYIAASDLIPESHRARGFKGSLALCGGILTAMAASWLAH